ncbi:MAG: hypothetical protein J7L42_03040 [Elusimicrobia bacterium]|nr:hypothetical protein [Elusimicrobiota bacterium]
MLFTKLRFLFTICCFLVSASAYWIGGYYEGYYEAWQEGEFKMNLTQPKHYLQLKTWLDPLPYSGIYIQGSASTWENNAKVKFDRAFAEKTFFKKFKTFVLFEEERHWISSPLLYLVETGKVQKNPEAIRFDFWNIGNLRGTFIFSKDKIQKDCEWYGNYFDVDGRSRIGRIEYYTPVFKTGINFIERKMEYEKFSYQGSTKTFLEKITRTNLVNSFDMKFDFPGFSLVGEFAKTTLNELDLKSNKAWQVELRDFILGPFWFTISGFNYGREFFVDSSRKFNGWDGNSEFGRKGIWSEMRFLIPRKAIDIIYKVSTYKTDVESVEANTDLRESYIVNYSTTTNRIFWDFTQIYARLLMGINFRLGYERTQNKLKNQKKQNLMLKIQAESPRKLIGLIFKIADYGKKTYPGQKYIIGIEQKLNFGDRFQFYYRFAKGFTEDIFWHSGFFQLRYFIGYDFEIFFELGESWPTDSLYSSTTFSNNTSLEFSKVAKFIMKMSF